jgi:hypothetical protein
MSWRKEFASDYNVPPEILSLVQSGKLSDESWHNDVCPRFVTPDPIDSREIWSDHPDPDQREMALPRYRVYQAVGGFEDYPPELCQTLYEGDNIASALAALTEGK